MILTFKRPLLAGMSAMAMAGFALALAAPAFSATLPAGTSITTVLTSADLNSKSAYVGQRFSLRVVPPYPNDDAAYTNAIVYGHVTNVVRASQGKKAQLNMAFDRIVLANGLQSTVTGHILQADVKQEDQTLQKAAGAGVGMVVGNIIGKKLGTNLGGLVGAGGGFLYANNLKAQIFIQTGAHITIQTDRSVVPGRRQSAR
ncbi:MAG: hypothetical protein GIW95_01440 [Candidatus Eremiobacteraeota bacterium]|nr:hypothetical protein [Candidatus Eremiobacteraeota bacterium]